MEKNNFRVFFSILLVNFCTNSFQPAGWKLINMENMFRSSPNFMVRSQWGYSFLQAKLLVVHERSLPSKRTLMANKATNLNFPSLLFALPKLGFHIFFYTIIPLFQFYVAQSNWTAHKMVRKHWRSKKLNIWNGVSVSSLFYET